MRGVYIIVEGLTESEFVNECLAPYFHLFGLYDVRPVSLHNHDRFLPYIQLHEFEGLLFADKKGFSYIPDVPEDNKKELEKIIEENPNPELINEGDETAPSKRLKKLIPGYQKTLHGPIIAIEIGVPTLRQKCPRFNLWIEKIIAHCNPHNL